MAKATGIPIKVEHEVTGIPHFKCLGCISDYVAAEQKGVPEADRPPIRDGVTLAPHWVNQTIMGQVMMACVAVPSCYVHLNVKEKTPQERAVEGGIIIGGGGSDGKL
jgi:hypothetical protein